MDKRTNRGIVDLLLVLDDGAKDIGAGGVVPEVFLNSLSEIKHDGRKHILSSQSVIIAVKVANTETISS